jgi:hypothetical protein
MIAMSFEDFLIVIVVAGIVLSGAYIRAEYILWRQFAAAERQRDSTLRELHAARLSQQQDDIFPSLVRLQTFAETQDAIPNDSACVEPDRRSVAQSNSQRNYGFVERRARPRHHATQ